MKATPETLISLSLILFFIHTNSLICANAQEPVRDYHGDEIIPGVPYYVTYFGDGSHGGIGLPINAKTMCPASVVEVPSAISLGLPVEFQPVDSGESRILESSTEVHVRFGAGASTGCPGGARAWRADEYDEGTDKTFVVAGSPVNSAFSSFTLVSQSGRNIYKFSICLDFAGLPCIDVGLYKYGQTTRLALNNGIDDIEYKVMFHRVRSVGIRLPK